MDGAIIVSHHTSDTFIDRIAAAVPVVYGGRPVRERERDYYVDVDNVAGGGMPRLPDRERTPSHRDDHRAAHDARRRRPAGGLPRCPGRAGLEEAAVEDGGFTTDGGAAAMRRILEQGDAPDALFVASDLMARGASSVLAAEGLRVPHDVAIVGFDDSPVATSCCPQLTTMRQPSFAQGEKMADILLDLLAGRDPRHITILETELVVRESA